ncbi:MAG TPA: TcpE family conjugal transfer membrane protein, partial [Streptosporangiaceae bacterium]|nr:TcpE family conjugal transfer membrane protein [Streptosporangiaceae bacterium]
MDLPTYTNIWRIEKRLYKLYDFRLPMPLPISWIAVFAGITIPYVFVLAAIGLPFNHDLVWLYVLPPGVLTWLTTRPVLENKRLPELLLSQLRYLGEPRTWCRMAPLAEKDEMRITAKVWHRSLVPAEQVAVLPAVAARPASAPARARVAAGAAVPGGAEEAGQARLERSPARRRATSPAGPGRKAVRGRPDRPVLAPRPSPSRQAPPRQIPSGQAPSRQAPPRPAHAGPPVWPHAGMDTAGAPAAGPAESRSPAAGAPAAAAGPAESRPPARPGTTGVPGLSSVPGVPDVPV